MIRRSGAIGFGLLAAALCASCAVTPNPNVGAFAEDTRENSFEAFESALSPQALVLPVEQDRQIALASCGAHVLASVVNYWRGPGTLRGEAVYRDTPPANPGGYSMAEIMSLARANGMLASAVRLDRAAILRELESGRPVLVPVRLPSVYVQQQTAPGADLPVADVAWRAIMDRAGSVSEFTGLAMVDHYLLVVGHERNRFVVLEPVMGLRTIAFRRLERYREAFQDAAIVFSAPGGRQRS